MNSIGKWLLPITLLFISVVNGVIIYALLTNKREINKAYDRGWQDGYGHAVIQFSGDGIEVLEGVHANKEKK